MTFKEKLNLFFHRDECVRTIIFDEKRKAYASIHRIKKEDTVIDVGGVSYVLDVQMVYYLEGVPTLSYHVSNTSPINPVDSKSEQFTSQTMNKIFRNKIVGDIIDTSEEDGMPIKNIIFLSMAVIIGVLGIGLFLLFKEVQNLQSSVDEYNDVITLIKEYLLQNGGR